MTSAKRAKPCETIVPPRAGIGEGGIISDEMSKHTEKPSLLLHSCCGPCSTSVVERLSCEFAVTIFFYNPNITDEAEYEKRRKTQKEFIKKYNDNPDNGEKIGFEEGPYDRRNFYAVAHLLEDEPEGGRRCSECFKLRLEKTAQFAQMRGYDLFGTTLTVSPHKDYLRISKIGKTLASLYRVGFLDRDFKKKDGYRRSVELSKTYDLYRQNYCGCEYSHREESGNSK